MSRSEQQIIDTNTKTYTHRDIALRAPLGGIGTGNISLDAGGRLCDFEFFGHPDKGVRYPYNFFAIWCRQAEGEPDARLLETVPQGISTAAIGVPSGALPGLPRFASSEYRCQYPFSRIDLHQPNYPLEVSLEAFTPFVPLDAEESGFPGFSITYTARNITQSPVEAAVAGTLYNLYGFTGYDGIDYVAQEGSPENRYLEPDALCAVHLAGSGLAAKHPTAGGLCLATPRQPGVTAKPHWRYGSWWDGAEEFWQDFRREGTLSSQVDSDTVGCRLASQHKKQIASLACKQTIAPGESARFTFYLAWHFPNRLGWWPRGHQPNEPLSDKPSFQTYYSTRWADAAAAVCWLAENYSRLYRISRDFADALYSSTLGPDVVESLVSSITVLRSPTCFRIADGTFFGWEGCFDHMGSCEGNCTHVWNYAQTLAFLFPTLEQSMRRTEFITEVDAQGRLPFRAHRRLEGEPFQMLPAADGQLGSILRVYREWQLGAGDSFLRELWPGLRRALDFSLTNWDRDGDRVMEYQQHNTYDIEFYGPTSLTNSILYAALKAGAEMARAVGEPEKAAEWMQALADGSHCMDTLLYNGSYYQQDISDQNLERYQYQYGRGCLSDQLLGQQLAHLYGLGYILPAAHTRSAIAAVFRHNFRRSLADHHSVQRGFATQAEGGLVLCSWPQGGRPSQPFVYSDEVWTGVEYQVATHLAWEGMTDQALDIVHAVRARYDGQRRSPFDEIECGHHYARSMAAWGLLAALSGYRFCLSRREISFAPRVQAEDFRCFYSCATSWGVYRQGSDAQGRWFQIDPLGGSLEGMTVNGQPYRAGRCTLG